MPNYIVCCYIVVLIMTVMPQRSSALTTGYSEAAVKQAQSLSVSQRDKLRQAGALDVVRPYHIKAELLGSNPEKWMRSNDSETTETKIIHFQRHGQGYHNLLGDVWRDLGFTIDIDSPDPQKNPFVKPEIVDSPLTEIGRQQCAARRMDASLLTPELVIVSPLHRAIQTAEITFCDHKRDDVPWVAHEGCREELGLLVCNKRRPLSESKKEFPDIDFSFVTSGEEDTLWHPTDRETPLAKSERAYKFLVDFVRTRPEKEIAVIGHSAWLFNMLNTVVDCDGDESLSAWFMTSEIRSMRMSFSERE